MSKIICDVCGTSYPDSAAQCPICGCVKPSNAENCGPEMEEDIGYAFVKGGRFSKSNVRKRVKTQPVEEIDEYEDAEGFEEPPKSSEKPLVITAIILLLAIAAIVVFITLRFFGPFADKPEQIPEETKTTTEATTDGSCTKLEVSAYEVEIPEGGTYKLNVIKEPAETTDELVFKSSDPGIATVDENGEITPVKTGTVTITVICGEQEIEVTVSCTVKEEPVFILDHMELELEYADQEWILYSGEIPVDDIVFSSDNEEVAVFAKGVVTAKGEGETVVRAQYGDLIVTCNVVCKFQDDSTGNEDGDNTGTDEELVTKAPQATGKKGYIIKTQFGKAFGSSPKFDVSHNVDGVLELYLVDAYGSRVTATWKVINTSICELDTTDGVKVTCKAKGTAFVVATTEDGETYVLTIRI